MTARRQEDGSFLAVFSVIITMKEVNAVYVNYNKNPRYARVGDCVIRAIATATGREWEDVFLDLCIHGLCKCDLPSADHVWSDYLRGLGYTQHLIGNTCPECYTLRQFCADHPKGVFIVCPSGHVVAVVNGDYLDTWDSGDTTPLSYWERNEGHELLPT